MSEYEFSISLSIRHPSMAPAEISRALGMQPQHSWAAGEERRGTTGEVLAGKYRETYWMGPLMAEPELASDRASIESVLLRTLSQLRRSFDFFADLSRSGGGAELSISVLGSGDFHLELLPESLALLGRLGLTVSLQVTPEPEEDAAASL
jgi:hypothetical protein